LSYASYDPRKYIPVSWLMLMLMLMLTHDAEPDFAVSFLSSLSLFGLWT